jgi:tetratricopeptide (TPR) repeat protein
MTSAIPCPDLTTLGRLLEGLLNEHEADALAAHVETCSSCSTRVRQLGEALDSRVQAPAEAETIAPAMVPSHAAAERHPSLDPGAETATVAPTPLAAATGDLPARIGRFQVEGEIARGGMGRIVRVRDEDFDRPLALKVLLGRGGELEERFVREARMTGLLQHPGIPPVHALGRLDDGRPWFVMKLVQGRSLHALLIERSQSNEDLPRFIGIFGQVCQTVGFAHARGVIHRDLKPLNIMVGAFGEVQVMDWGLAKLLSDTRAEAPTDEPAAPLTARAAEAIASGMQTRAGSVLGTPAFMSPEQAGGALDRVDARSDVFGLGGILSDILTGKPPYVATSSEQVFLMAVMGDLTEAHARLAGCGADPELVSLARRCLAPRPEDRPENGAEVAEAVAAYQAELEQRLRQAEIDRAAEQARANEEQRRRVAEEGRAQAERKRRRMAMALAAAVVVLIAGGSLAALWYQAERVQRASELALRREAMNKEVAIALNEVSDRRKQLFGTLTDPHRVHELLSDIDRWQALLREASAPWKQAQVLVTGAPELLDEELAARLQELRQALDADEKDWQLARELDDIRLEGSTLVQGKQDYGRAARRYAAIFKDDLDVAKRPPDDAARFIASTPTRHVLVAALDHWAQTTASRELRSRILEVARKADPHPWRDRFRNRDVWYERAQLEQLAKELQPAEHSPQLIVVFMATLERTRGSTDHILRRALLQHPRDFWLHYLSAFSGKTPVERESRYYAALALRPRSARVHNSLGWALRENKDLDGALAEFHKALECNANDVLAYNHLGLAMHDRNDLQHSLAYYRKAIELDPHYALSYTNLGLTLEDMNDLDGAFAHYRKAVDLDPNLALAQNNLGTALFKQGDWNRAISHLRKAIELEPDFAGAHSNLGGALNAINDLDGALTHHRKAVELDPNFAEAQCNLGIVLGRKNDFDGAITHYRKAIELKPGLAKAHFNLAHILSDRKDLDGAIMHYRKAVEIQPTYAIAHANLGTTLLARKDLDGAITHYRKALECDPTMPSIHYFLGNAFLGKKDLPGAIAEYRNAIESDPNDVMAHRNLGVAYYSQKNLDAAIAQFHKAIALEPDFAPPYSNLGLALIDKDDLQGAIAQFRKAIAIDPGFAFAYANLGLALARMKDLEGAISQYSKAIELDPRNAGLHNSLGALLMEKRDFAAAITHYRKVSEINPTDFYASAGLAQALLETGQFSAAREAALKTSKLLPMGHPLLPRGQALLRQCDMLLALDDKLRAFIDSGEPPRGLQEQISLATFCYRYKGFHASAVCLYSAAFAAAPRVADDLAKGHRYNAARAAVLAAARKGRDPKSLDEPELAKLRDQALQWLRAHLGLCATRVEAGRVEDVMVVLDSLPAWQRDPDLASVRDGNASAALPEKEQKAWRVLWMEADKMLATLRARVTETTLKGRLTDREREQVHPLKMDANKSYVIEMHSTELDSYLKLVDAANQLLAEHDDIAADNKDARLIFTPKEDGTFRIVATSFQQQGRGAYTVTVRAIVGPTR